MATPTDAEYRAREHLYSRIHDGIRYARPTLGGFNPGSSHRGW